MRKLMKRGAEISECGTYRYMLWRDWGEVVKNTVTFVMLNPSTADGEVDDPTIRRCIGFTRDWGFTAFNVVNVLAYRATKPHDIPTTNLETAIGPENARWIEFALMGSDLIVPAWGSFRNPFMQAYEIAGEIIARVSRNLMIPVEALVLNADGSPKHPLYVPSDVTRVPYVIEHAGLRSTG